MADRLVNLELDLLRAFVTVVETASFTRAAAMLGRTQPAVSLQIRRLEDRLRSPLLDRGGKGVALTTEGAALLPHARRLLRLNDEIVSTLGEGDLEGEVRFGAPDDIATMHLPGILGAFARSHPRISLAVTCDYTANLLDQMSRGMLDLALIKREPVGPELGVRVWSEPLVWVALDASIVETTPLPLIIAPAPDIYRKRALGALQAAAETLNNRAMRSDAMAALVQVREGAPLANALAAKKRFPGLLPMFARLGEQTGTLPQMLQRAATQLSLEVQRRAMALATVLEPLLIVAMGAMVMLIVLAVLLPIIQLNTWVK